MILKILKLDFINEWINLILKQAIGNHYTSGITPIIMSILKNKDNITCR